MNMSRNKRFHHGREPLRHEESLLLLDQHVNGPFSFLNPTYARFAHTTLSATATTTTEPDCTDRARYKDGDTTPQSASGVHFHWTSRNNRKGRHAITVSAQKDQSKPNYVAPRSTASWRPILKTAWRMLVYYPVWDISWCVAYIFTWGSIIWVLNGLFVFLPFIQPSWTFHNETLVGGGVTAFIGASIFVIGSVLLLLEAVNENREGCFGWAVEQAYNDHLVVWRLRPDSNACTHSHSSKRSFLGKPHVTTSTPQVTQSSIICSDEKQMDDGLKRSWSWCPSWYELKTHYFHDLGFIACASQMIGATVFYISGFTALPGINNKLSSAALDGAYWFPQILGAIFFVISGLLFMIETQRRWWLPAPRVLGWHIGFWNLVGGFGFLLSPCFGYSSQHWAQYQAACVTLWASCAFLLGSGIQLYESLDKSPVEIKEAA